MLFIDERMSIIFAGALTAHAVINGEQYYYELPGLAAQDPESDTFPEAKKPSRVKFSTAPIRVCLTLYLLDGDLSVMF